MELTQVPLYNNNTSTDRIWQKEGLQTYSFLTVCFGEPQFTCLVDPLGSSISQHPWLSPPKQRRLRGLGPRLWSSHNSLNSQRGSRDFLQRVSLCSYSPGGPSQVIYESEWIAEQNSAPQGAETDTPPVTLLLCWGTLVMKNLSLCDVQYLQLLYLMCKVTYSK